VRSTRQAWKTIGAKAIRCARPSRRKRILDRTERNSSSGPSRRHRRPNPSSFMIRHCHAQSFRLTNAMVSPADGEGYRGLPFEEPRASEIPRPVWDRLWGAVCTKSCSVNEWPNNFARNSSTVISAGLPRLTVRSLRTHHEPVDALDPNPTHSRSYGFAAAANTVIVCWSRPGSEGGTTAIVQGIRGPYVLKMRTMRVWTPCCCR